MAHILKRIALVIPTLLGISIIAFSLIHLIPGDIVTAILGLEGAKDPELRRRLESTLLLDRPLYEQYLVWLSRVIQGNLGDSLIYGTPVITEVLRRIPATALLTTMGLMIAVALGIPLGVVSAVARGRATDGIVRLVSLILISLPSFFVGALMIVVASIYAPGMRIIGYSPFEQDPIRSVAQMFWPALALALGLMALFLRYTRSAMLDVLSQDYIRTARSKGLRERSVLFRHALRNALLPVISVIGAQTAYLVGGAILIENVFAIPGIGRLMLNAISQRDYPMVQGAVLVVATGVVLVNIVVDIAYRLADPRLNLR